jgi:hypothetical protein
MRLAQTQLRTPAPVFPPPDSTKSGRGLEFGKEVGQMLVSMLGSSCRPHRLDCGCAFGGLWIVSAGQDCG